MCHREIDDVKPDVRARGDVWFVQTERCARGHSWTRLMLCARSQMNRHDCSTALVLEKQLLGATEDRGPRSSKARHWMRRWLTRTRTQVAAQKHYKRAASPRGRLLWWRRPSAALVFTPTPTPHTRGALLANGTHHHWVYRYSHRLEWAVTGSAVGQSAAHRCTYDATILHFAGDEKKDEHKKRSDWGGGRRGDTPILSVWNQERLVLLCNLK